MEEDRLGEMLRRMTRRNRASLLRTIVHHMDSSDAHYLLELVKEKLTFDPLRELPQELRQRVLEKIDPLTLLKMAGACSNWRVSIMKNALLWRYAMRRENMSGVGRKMLHSTNNNSLMEPSVCIKVLKWETKLGRNWMEGNYTKNICITAHGASVITCLQLDESRNRLISGADNGTVGIWDIRSGENREMLTGHQGGVWTLRVEGDTLVTGSTDRTLILWNISDNAGDGGLEGVEEGRRMADLTGHSSTVRCVEIVGGEFIVSGSRDGTLRVWRLPSSKRGRNQNYTINNCLHILTGHTASVRCIVPWGSHYIVSGSYDSTLRVWDLSSGKCVATCQGHDGKVYSLAASRQYVFSGGTDTKIRVWRPLTGECVDVFSEHSGLVGLLQVKGDVLVAGSTDGALSLWNISSLTRIRHIEYAHKGSVTALDFNSHVLFSGSERSLRSWSIPELRGDEPPESNIISDKMDVVWRIVVGETHAAIAYQQAGITKIDILSFAPPPDD